MGGWVGGWVGDCLPWGAGEGGGDHGGDLARAIHEFVGAVVEDAHRGNELPGPELHALSPVGR